MLFKSLRLKKKLKLKYRKKKISSQVRLYRLVKRIRLKKSRSILRFILHKHIRKNYNIRFIHFRVLPVTSTLIGHLLLTEKRSKNRIVNRLIKSVTKRQRFLITKRIERLLRLFKFIRRSGTRFKKFIIKKGRR